MTDTSGMLALAAQSYSGRAIGALVVSIAAAIIASSSPIPALLLGAIAVALALGCRAELRQRPELAGWGLSLAAMIIGSVVVALTALPLLAPIMLAAVALLL